MNSEITQRIMDNLNLVDKVVSKHFRFKIYFMFDNAMYDDFIQEGRLGLIDAAEKFNSSLNPNFEAYAWRRIKGTCTDWLRVELARGLRPYNSLTRTRKDKVELIPTDFIANSGYDEDDDRGEEQLANRWNLVDRDLENTLGNFQILSLAVKKLNYRETVIAIQFFFLGNTMKVIGEKLGISQARISQIMNLDILPAMKKVLRDNDFK